MQSDRVDAAVVGSGAAGLTAALAAAVDGARVMVLERAAVFGGTSAISGGSLWIPNNRWMREAGIPDSRADALAYIKRLTLDRVDDRLIETFVDECNPLTDFIERETTIRFASNLTHADYQSNLPGAKPGGRTIQGDLFDTNLLGTFKDTIRAGTTALPLTKLEIDSWGKGTARLENWDFALLARRMEAGLVGLGRALVGSLMEACLRHGVQLAASCRAVELMRDGDRVSGLIVERAGGASQRVEAAGGVMLASGGFEWNQAMVNQFLGVPMNGPSSPPLNAGDGLRMAMSVGAGLANMSEAWWVPTLSIPGESYDGQPMFRNVNDLRGMPGLIIVNRRGQRFANEALNYNDFAKSMMVFDPGAYTYANLPCFMVFDGRFRRSYSIATVTPDSKTPAWLVEAPSLAELAERVGIDPRGLVAQVEEFNRHAVHGEDPRFHRGESAYDRYRGDPAVTPNPNVRSLDEGPYYAVELKLGSLGTKGGPQTDERGQVLDAFGERIPGLYAAGNVAANVFGPGYPGAGATLASAMTFARLAGQTIAAECRALAHA